MAAKAKAGQDQQRSSNPKERGEGAAGSASAANGLSAKDGSPSDTNHEADSEARLQEDRIIEEESEARDDDESWSSRKSRSGQDDSTEQQNAQNSVKDGENEPKSSAVTRSNEGRRNGRGVRKESSQGLTKHSKGAPKKHGKSSVNVKLADDDLTPYESQNALNQTYGHSQNLQEGFMNQMKLTDDAEEAENNEENLVVMERDEESNGVVGGDRESPEPERAND